ncbi:hypothetical protein CEXT_354251 [Caerostris extrusa]|uniref:Secreted protein n=1 Tax=Caerostris extrusa TaxID=172846 RepID=A0AAV4UQK1_CAEEX|nr:hypothetical protein CEXT_354251 [Caerostris extrusa]
MRSRILHLLVGQGLRGSATCEVTVGAMNGHKNNKKEGCFVGKTLNRRSHPSLFRYGAAPVLLRSFKLTSPHCPGRECFLDMLLAH